MSWLPFSVPPWVRRGAQIVVAVGLFVLLWRTADGPEALRNLAAAELRWLAAAFASLTLQTIFSALRWRVTARQFGIRLGVKRALSEYYLAQIVNQSLPGGMVGDASRAVRARGQAGLLASGQAVVFERLAGQVAMFVTMAVAFFITIAFPGGLDWPRWLAVPLALVILGGMALPFALGALARLPAAVGRGAARLWTALHLGLAARRVLPWQILFSIVTTVCNLAAFWFCAQAVGVDLALAATAALVPLILFTMLIPITISGWGLREGAAAALLPLTGASASQGLATSVAFGLVFILAVLPGAIFIWRPVPSEKIEI